MSSWRKPSSDLKPHWFLLGMLANSLIVVGLVGSAVFVKAWATGTLPPADPIPWGTYIQAGGTAVTAFLAWMLRGQVQQLHLTFNSKMDEYLKLVKLAAEAEGVVKERARADSLLAAKAEGIVEGSKEKPSGP